jgi:hypothetical protein
VDLPEPSNPSSQTAGIWSSSYQPLWWNTRSNLCGRQQKKKILAGLEAPEADQVLKGLGHLGVDTIHDPAMPMTVEMALERRKSRFGLL